MFHGDSHENEMHTGGGGCPSSQILSFDEEETESGEQSAQSVPTALRQWPIQLHLVPPFAPYFEGADLLIAADCVPFAYGDFHTDASMLKGRAVAIACPKLDDTGPYVDKIASIIDEAGLKSITVAIMEVPCCFGLKSMIEQAIEKAERDVPLETVVFSIRGDKQS